MRVTTQKWHRNQRYGDFDYKFLPTDTRFNLQSSQSPGRKFRRLFVRHCVTDLDGVATHFAIFNVSLTYYRVGFNEIGTPADRVVPCEEGARLHYQGARAVRIPVLQDSNRNRAYVVGRAAAACSKIFTALPTSATPKITNVALVPGSVPL
jgi:hypothetical protein